MTQRFHELLLSELRMAVYRPGNPDRITDQRLCESVTLNENLRALGFALRTVDMINLAGSDSLYTLYDDLARLVPEVKAQPMYPGFPEEVLEMSEAKFRMHQALHYASTSGIELVTGEKVSRGWLPESNYPIRTEADIELLDRKMIELVPEAEAPFTAMRILMDRRERMTCPELALAMECVSVCEAEKMEGLRIRFKENLDLLFPILMENANRKTALSVLRGICAHSGDVLRCAKDYLRQKKFHLSTAEKKLLVRLLESYPVGNFRQNLMLSLRLRERNLLILQHLDYNRFSRSGQHREAVRALRNGELLSWHGVGEELLATRSPKALDHFAQRPGYMIRMLNRLISLGYSPEKIQGVMIPRADTISGHLVLKTLSTLADRKRKLASKHAEEINHCIERYRMEVIEPRFRFSEIEWQAEARIAQAKIRYIDQPKRELHKQVFERLNKLRTEIRKMEKSISEKKVYFSGLEKGIFANQHPMFIRNAGKDFMDSLFLTAASGKDAIFWLREQILQDEQNLALLRENTEQYRKESKQHYAEQLEELEVNSQRDYAAELEAIRIWKQNETYREEREYGERLRDYRERMKTLPERRAAELAKLEKKHVAELNSSRFDSESVTILRTLLKAHFQMAQTPFKGKKVCLALEQFDLEHSVLETSNRSKDGGYIRSGICYRIPENARYVRFFVYWNDRTRVDIDLHAGGHTTDGETLHIGWNADFKNSGVVHSGDITHSNAAEYIDIDLSAPIQEISVNIHLFSGKRTLRDVENCYVGLMAVSEANQSVKRYDPKNCFFTHRISQNASSLFYGYINVQERYVRFVGQPNVGRWEAIPDCAGENADIFSFRDYLDCMLEGQNCQMVSKEEADVIMTMGKNDLENGLSLVDHNFFLES